MAIWLDFSKFNGYTLFVNVEGFLLSTDTLQMDYRLQNGTSELSFIS